MVHSRLKFFLNFKKLKHNFILYKPNFNDDFLNLSFRLDEAIKYKCSDEFIYLRYFRSDCDFEPYDYDKKVIESIKDLPKVIKNKKVIKNFSLVNVYYF